jgi:hypothetical protein
MQQFEYKVIPAPDRGEKVRGAKTQGERYAQALTSVLNRMGREGWDYVRAEVLPSEERSGLTRRTTVYHNVLVFRRALDTDIAAAPAPRPLMTDAPIGNAPRLASPAAPAPAEAAPLHAPKA